MRKSSFYYHEGRDVVYRRLGFLGFPNYRVGTDGSVWSRNRCGGQGDHRFVGKWRRRHVVSGKHSSHPYVLLWDCAKYKAFAVHRLVLLAFVGPRPNGMECRHFPDRDPTNNRLENLQWGTLLENRKDRVRQSSNGFKLTNEYALWIRNLADKQPTTTTGKMKKGCCIKIASMVKRKFGVDITPETVSMIHSRKTWMHL